LDYQGLSGHCYYACRRVFLSTDDRVMKGVGYVFMAVGFAESIRQARDVGFLKAAFRLHFTDRELIILPIGSGLMLIGFLILTYG
jgi:hypothetical protein